MCASVFAEEYTRRSTLGLRSACCDVDPNRNFCDVIALRTLQTGHPMASSHTMATFQCYRLDIQAQNDAGNYDCKTVPSWYPRMIYENMFVAPQVLLIVVPLWSDELPSTCWKWILFRIFETQCDDYDHTLGKSLVCGARHCNDVVLLIMEAACRSFFTHDFLESTKVLKVKLRVCFRSTARSL